MTEPAPRARRNRQRRLYSGASENPFAERLEVAVSFRHWSGRRFCFRQGHRYEADINDIGPAKGTVDHTFKVWRESLTQLLLRLSGRWCAARIDAQSTPEGSVRTSTRRLEAIGAKVAIVVMNSVRYNPYTP
jgi:hypothetical protein